MLKGREGAPPAFSFLRNEKPVRKKTAPVFKAEDQSIKLGFGRTQITVILQRQHFA